MIGTMFLALAITYPLLWNITMNTKKATAEATVRQIVDAQTALQTPVEFSAATMKAAFNTLKLNVPFNDGFEYEAIRDSASAPLVVQARADMTLIDSSWFPAAPLVYRFDMESQEGAWSGEASQRTGLGLF
jgi:hypothetical protein